MWHVKHVLTSRYLEKNTIFLFRNKNSQQKSFLARLYISISRTIFLLFGSRTGVPKICQRARPLIQEQTVRFYLPPLAYASRHMFQPTFFPQHSSTERLIHLPPLLRSHHCMQIVSLMNYLNVHAPLFLIVSCDAHTHCDVLRVSVRRTVMSFWRGLQF